MKEFKKPRFCEKSPELRKKARKLRWVQNPRNRGFFSRKILKSIYRRFSIFKSKDLEVRTCALSFKKIHISQNLLQLYFLNLHMKVEIVKKFYNSSHLPPLSIFEFQKNYINNFPNFPEKLSTFHKFQPILVRDFFSFAMYDF